MTKVVIADTGTKEQIANWHDFGIRYGLDVAMPSTSDEEELFRLLPDAEILVTQKVTIDERIMNAAPKLRLIQKMGSRADNIDLEAAKRRRINVSVVSLPGSVAVAEHAMMLILACAKKLILAHELTVKGAYRDLGIEPKLTSQKSHGFQWMKIPDLQELNRSTLGIFGFGDIGNEIAKRAHAFEMEILYFKRHPLPEKMEEELGVKYVSKEELFKRSDFLVMISPLTPETEKAAGAEEFALMKPTAYFINCCRGGVVDEEALVETLKNHRIAGAGLDVFVYEPIPYDHPLLSLDNVTLTPHIAGGKGNAAERQIYTVLENIQKYLKNEPLKNLIC